MVTIEIRDGALHVEVEGWDKLWALKSRLVVPLAHVRAVRADAEIARGWWKGIRVPGTHIPGVIIAGTFLQDGRRTFWDVHDAERAIVVELAGERYDRLVVEVEHPMATVSRIQAALAAAGRGASVA